MMSEAGTFARQDRLILILGDGLIFFLSLTATHFFFPALSCWDHFRHPAHLAAFYGLFICFSLLTYYAAGIYEFLPWGLPHLSRGLPKYFLASLTLFLIFSGLSYLFDLSRPPTSPWFFFALFSVSLSLGWHGLACHLPMSRKGGILFLGEDPIIEELIETIMQERSHTLKIVKYHEAIVDKDEDLLATIRKNNIRTVIYSNKMIDSQINFDELLKLRLKGVSVYEALPYYQKTTRKLPVHCLDARTLLNFSQNASLSRPIYAIAKRTVDLIGALVLLPFALPVIFLCALAIKLDSPGPVFFIQERLGLEGKPFRLIKLRTMVDQAEKHTPQWCRDNDPRITRVGKILRKLRIDELPQLLNVLKNEMSLVGPRPIRQHFTDLLAREIPFYRLRLLAKPGLTGWAQVHSGHANTLEGHTQMVQYDLFYILNSSLWLDFLTLLKTVRVIFLGKGR